MHGGKDSWAQGYTAEVFSHYQSLLSRCSVAVKITLTGKGERISQFKIYFLYLFLSYDPVDTYVTFFNSHRIE